MFTLTCSLRFRDGHTVTARIKARTKIEDAPVEYSGSIERLPLVTSKATAVELQAYFKSFARELKARYDEVEVDDRVVPSVPMDEALEYLVALGAVRRCAENVGNGHTKSPPPHPKRSLNGGKRHDD
jgi:hypothetical protein